MEGVTYRRMSDADHSQVIPIWIETWGYTDFEYLKRRIAVDSGYLDHTFVAAGGTGLAGNVQAACGGA